MVPRFVGGDHVELQVQRFDIDTNTLERTLVHLRPEGAEMVSVRDSYAAPGELDVMGHVYGLRRVGRYRTWDRKLLPWITWRRVTRCPHFMSLHEYQDVTNGRGGHNRPIWSTWDPASGTAADYYDIDSFAGLIRSEFASQQPRIMLTEQGVLLKSNTKPAGYPTYGSAAAQVDAANRWLGLASRSRLIALETYYEPFGQDSFDSGLVSRSNSETVPQQGNLPAFRPTYCVLTRQTLSNCTSDGKKDVGRNSRRAATLIQTMRALFLISCLLGAWWSPTATAAVVTPLGRVSVRGSNDTLAIAARNRVVTVLSRAGGQWSAGSVDMPAGCALAAAGAGTVIFDCDRQPDRTVTPWEYHLGDTGLTVVPGADALRSYELRYDIMEVHSQAIGSRVLRTLVSTPKGAASLWLNPATQAVSVEPSTTAREVPSLDAPGGRVTLCQPLRRPLVRSDSIDGGYVPATVLYRGNHMVSFRFTRKQTEQAVIHSCGRHATTVVGPVRGGEVLSERYFAWASGSLHVRSLLSGVTRVVRTPNRCSYVLGGGRYLICARGVNASQASLIDFGT